MARAFSPSRLHPMGRCCARCTLAPLDTPTARTRRLLAGLAVGAIFAVAIAGPRFFTVILGGIP